MLLQPDYNLFGYCLQNPTNRVDPDGATSFTQADWDMMSNRSLLSPFNLSAIGGGYQGNTNGIRSSYSVWKTTQAYNERWISSGYNAPQITAANTVTPEQLKTFATNAAKEYIENNPGSGTVYGTHGHTYVENQIKAQNWTNVDIEVSYLNGASTRYGMTGSIRLDIVIVDAANVPKYAIDLKFGITPLTQKRINQILSHLPTEIHIDQVP